MSTTKILSAFLIGAAAGAALGVIFAPGKGSDLRKDITEKAKDLADAILAKAEEIVDEAESVAMNSRSGKARS
jgi:gas vesicle protein